ncbi:MAG: hypothetical protein EOP07_21950 [Proteobacteria bacterium]|nr:MAG: hypothetical protein EOP07_21950 [Pseudomonadota bacterium]
MLALANVLVCIPSGLATARSFAPNPKISSCNSVRWAMLRKMWRLIPKTAKVLSLTLYWNHSLISCKPSKKFYTGLKVSRTSWIARQSRKSKIMSLHRSESSQLLRLAIPVVISQVGAMTMGIVDSIIVGRYSSLELAGVAAGNSIFWMIVMMGFGLLHGMDPIVAGANGSGHIEDAERCLGSALKMGAVFSLIFTPIILIIANNLWITGATPEVIHATVPFLRTLAFSLWPLMIYGALSRYWQAFEIALPFTATIIFANLVNWAGNYAFVPGHWGFDAYGARGAAIATTVCRIFTLLAAVWISVYFWRKKTDKPWQHLFDPSYCFKYCILCLYVPSWTLIGNRGKGWLSPRARP